MNIRTQGDLLANCNPLDAYNALVALCDRFNESTAGRTDDAGDGRAQPVSSVPPVANVTGRASACAGRKAEAMRRPSPSANADASPDGQERRQSGKPQGCARVSPSVRNRTTA